MDYMGSTTTVDKTSEGFLDKASFADDGARELLSESLSDLSSPDPSAWEVVKHNVSRTVYRGQIDGVGIYIKHFHSRSIIHRLLRHIGFSDAKWEMKFIQYLGGHGVETAPALAAICADGVEWLATRAVAPAQQADTWHAEQLKQGPQGRRKIQQAIISLGEMVGRMHAAGVLHRDLHTGNILVLTKANPPRLMLMDLHRATRRQELSRRARAANLAQIYHDRYYFTTRSERLRFLKHYLKAGGGEGTLRGWQRMIERFAQRHTRRQHAHRDRRVRRRNRYFVPLKLQRGWRGLAVLASKRRLAGSQAAEMIFDEQSWKDVLTQPENLFVGDDVTVLKDSPSSLVVRRMLTVGTDSVEVIIKRRRRKRPWKIVPDCFRPARSIRTFRLGHALLTRRTATALPLAALQRRVGPFLMDSILITEAVKGQQLHDFLNTWLARPPRGDTQLSVAQQRHLAQEVFWQLGRILRNLHDNNFAHRDMKATNLIVRWSLGQTPEVVLLDLDGLSSRRRVTTRMKFQGLMRLNVSLLQCPVVNHAGRLRMLLGYLRRPGSGRINFKPYWRVLEKWSAKKLDQQIRSLRKKQRAARRPSK